MRIIGAPVDVYSSKSVFFSDVKKLLAEGGGYVCFANAHMLVEYNDSEEFRQVMEKASIVCPDGRPLSVIQKIRGLPASQIRGEDATYYLCGQTGYRIGFYGSSGEVIEALVKNIRLKNPFAEVVFNYSPPFRELSESEIDELAEKINLASVDFLFVGLGCPKQEIFMCRINDRLNCVMFGVGAAFDFISGNKKGAPVFFSRFGLEWAFRLVSEPRRLFWRYFYTNSKFLFLIIKSFLSR